jgi:hypothetical protein
MRPTCLFLLIFVTNPNPSDSNKFATPSLVCIIVYLKPPWPPLQQASFSWTLPPLLTCPTKSSALLPSAVSIQTLDFSYKLSLGFLQSHWTFLAQNHLQIRGVFSGFGGILLKLWRCSNLKKKGSWTGSRMGMYIWRSVVEMHPSRQIKVWRVWCWALCIVLMRG